MKKLALVLAVTVSSFVFGQKSFEVIPQVKNLFNAGGFGDLELVNNDDVLVYIYSNDPVNIVPVEQYLNSFEFNKYLNTNLYEVNFEVNDNFMALIADPDVPEDLTVVGYKETIEIKDIRTNKYVLSITVFYENYSSLISNITVFTADAIIN
jgi:hypothetical protein